MPTPSHPRDHVYRDLVAAGMRAPQQMAILKLWQRLCESSDVPPASALQPNDLSRFMEWIAFCDVQRVTPEPRFLIRFMGAQLKVAYLGDGVGKYVDQVVAPAVRREALDAYRSATLERRPHFSTSKIRTVGGRIVLYERLLLPFAQAGDKVDRLLAVVSLFCEDNGFQLTDLTTAQRVA